MYQTNIIKWHKSGGGGERKILCYLIGKPPSLNNSFEKSVLREVKTMWLYDTIFSIPLFLLVFFYILFVVTICDDLNTQQILDQYCSGNEFKFFWLLKSFARSRSVFLELILTVFLLDFLWSKCWQLNDFWCMVEVLYRDCFISLQQLM